MAWSWSHTIDAYEDAREQVQRLSKAELLTILREWAYYDREQANTLRFHGSQVWTDTRGKTRVRGFRLPNGVRRLTQDTLADLVWDRMSAHATCTNGGWDAYCCPDGCHTVPFAPVDDQTDSD